MKKLKQSQKDIKSGGIKILGLGRRDLRGMGNKYYPNNKGNAQAAVTSEKSQSGLNV